jgi:hypothetical protein
LAWHAFKGTAAVHRCASAAIGRKNHASAYANCSFRKRPVFLPDRALWLIGYIHELTEFPETSSR